MDGLSLTLATAVAVPPLLGAALPPLLGREVARDGPWEGNPEGGAGGVEGLMCIERVTLGVMPSTLRELFPAHSTGQTCITQRQACQIKADPTCCLRKQSGRLYCMSKVVNGSISSLSGAVTLLGVVMCPLMVYASAGTIFGTGI